MLKKFSLAALKDLRNGEVDAQFVEMVADVIKEIERRPDVSKPRTIAMKVEFTPLMVAGALDDVVVTVGFTSSTPKYESRAYTMQPKSDGSLFFQPSSPENPNQLSLDDAGRQ